MASNLYKQVIKISAIFIMRWAASSLRTIKAEWNLYNAFATWFSEANDDDTRFSNECNIFTSLHSHLTSEYFDANLALMYDGLDELASLSLLLQSYSITN